FPYPEGVVSAPAPQPLARTADGWRLDLALADGATPPDALDGVLLVDGRPHELRARLQAGPAPTGTTVSVADRPAGLSRPAGAGGGLLGALGGATGASAAGTAAPGSGEPAPAAAGGDAGLALALAFGAIGGLILNLMPCVFPVVGLKVLGFAKAAGDSRGARRAMRRGAVAFTAGVLLSFWGLAGAMLALRAAGESVGWGFQLQSPAFVAAMALLFVAVGLNFAGTFEAGLSLTRLGGVGDGGSTAGSFGAGVLAVLVATPCTAPFMGSALGFTLSQPAAHTMAVFTAIGLGMALPYLALGWFPGWIARLPRPGRWMETLKQALAFPMFATAAWLAWVLVQQSGADALLRLLLAAVLVGLAAWAWGRFGAGARPRPVLAWSTLVASLAAGAALLAPLGEPPAAAAAPGAPVATDAAGVEWRPWSEQAVRDGLAAGRTVFVDFTAAWCVSCQANKKLVLERGPVAAAMRDGDVLALRADWTQRDPAITAALARHGRNGVPLYLVHRPGRAEPVVLPELLTTGTVVDALR
ncbi:MAG TPA: thioredoxin family protein, partial [Burkholderiaceae bacterium]|nr:thioredoxin family protein [Burkholderiaceae bacterium]